MPLTREDVKILKPADATYFNVLVFVCCCKEATS